MGRYDIMDYLDFGGDKPITLLPEEAALDAPGKLSLMLNRGHTLCVYGQLCKDHMLIAGTDIKLPYHSLIPLPVSKGEKVVAVVNSSWVLGYRPLSDCKMVECTVSVKEDGFFKGGGFKTNVCSYARYAGSTHTFTIPSAMQGNYMRCSVPNEDYEFSGVVITDFADEQPKSSGSYIENKINDLLEKGTYVVVFGNWYDDYLMVAGTEIKADMKYLTVKPTCQGERAVATIHMEGALGIQAVMVQSFDEGAVRLRHVRVREGGVVKVKNERQNQEIFASVEHVGKAERLLIADQMLVRQYKGDKHSVAVITEFTANPKQALRASRNVEVQYPSQENVVEYILSKLPPAVTSGLSEQERVALALDTVKQFM